jgi:hypothetical protein
VTTNINELNLDPEGIPDIDFDAPEAGSFPPQLVPGTYDFTFRLAEDPWTTMENNGHKYMQVNYEAVALDGQNQEVTLKFQRASTFLTDKMRNAHMNHAVGELLRSLAVRLEGKLDKGRIADAFLEASAQGRHFKGRVEWRRYCKACEKTMSTSPRRSKGEMDWPKQESGKYELAIKCPGCGEKGYGTAQINRFLLPESNGQPNQSQQVVSAVEVRELA